MHRPEKDRRREGRFGLGDVPGRAALSFHVSSKAFSNAFNRQHDCPILCLFSASINSRRRLVELALARDNGFSVYSEHMRFNAYHRRIMVRGA